jgi:hypothetical protein
MKILVVDTIYWKYRSKRYFGHGMAATDCAPVQKSTFNTPYFGHNFSLRIPMLMILDYMESL